MSFSLQPNALPLVVGAAIVDDLSSPTALLAAARSYPEKWRGYWEFPGGKAEVGEDGPAALRRELREELGCEIEVGEPILRPATWTLAAGKAQLDGDRAGKLQVGEVQADLGAPGQAEAGARLGEPGNQVWLEGEELREYPHLWDWRGLEAQDWRAHGDFRLRIYRAVLREGSVPHLGKDHLECRWVDLEEAAGLQWLPANRLILRAWLEG